MSLNTVLPKMQLNICKELIKVKNNHKKILIYAIVNRFATGNKFPEQKD